MSDFTTWRSLVDGEEISAIPDTVVLPESDDLEHFEGDTGQYEINDDEPVIFTEVNNLSVKNTSGSSEEDRIVSFSGLDNYPEQGDTFSCFLREDGSQPLAIMLFGVQNYDFEFYGAGIADGVSEFRLFKDGLGGGDTIASTSVSLSTEEWYDVEVEWETDGTITARLFEVDQSSGERQSQMESISATDTDYSNGGVGFAKGLSSGNATFDFYRLGGGVGE